MSPPQAFLRDPKRLVELIGSVPMNAAATATTTNGLNNASGSIEWAPQGTMLAWTKLDVAGKFSRRIHLSDVWQRRSSSSSKSES